MTLSLYDAIALEPDGAGRWRGHNTDEGGGAVIFGGQLLAQQIVAAARTANGDEGAMRVKSIHTIFCRGGSRDADVDLLVDVMHQGRSFASATVSVEQAGRLCCRSLVLLDAADADLVTHGPAFPDVSPPPADATPNWWQIETVGGVNISDPEAVGPPELQVWTRFPDAPDDPLVSQALFAYATDGFLIGTAMRPHAGLGQSMAHVTVATTVLTHTLSFNEPFSAAEWLLLDQHSEYAGKGRAYGRAHVFTQDGRYVASFVQESMLRDIPPGGRG